MTLIKQTKTKIPTRTDYVEKREIYQPYSFDDLFQLVHVDVANLSIFRKISCHP